MRQSFEDCGICRCCLLKYVCKKSMCNIIKIALEGITHPTFKE